MTQSVLFICQLNSVRSPMAEGLTKKLHPEVSRVSSCGLTPIEPNDFMITVMREVGVDMSEHGPLALSDVQDVHFDLIIAFTESAKQAADAVFEGKDVEIVLWPLPDPGEGSLDVRAMLNNYRAIRDNLKMRLARQFG